MAVVASTGLAALVEQERAHKLADARAQVAYEAELAQHKLSKLQQYFTSSLSVPHVTVFSMSGNSSTSTLRQAGLPKELQVRVLYSPVHRAQLLYDDSIVAHLPMTLYFAL